MSPTKASLIVSPAGAVMSCAKNHEEACGFKPGSKVCGKCGAVPQMANAEEEVESEESGKADTTSTEVKVTLSPYQFDGFALGDADQLKTLRASARAARRDAMGVKSADDTADGFLCGAQRKMLPGDSAPCAGCTGGCAAGELPNLLEVEGISQQIFNGKVLDSGYGDRSDLFLVHVQRQDGKVVEAYFDGQTAEMKGWHLLADDILGEKTAAPTIDIIGTDEAAELAIKQIPGDVTNVDAERWSDGDGATHDAWVVEIDGLDGKTYDVFVGLDGKVLGYDEFELEDVDDDEEDGDDGDEEGSEDGDADPAEPVVATDDPADDPAEKTAEGVVALDPESARLFQDMAELDLLFLDTELK